MYFSAKQRYLFTIYTKLLVFLGRITLYYLRMCIFCCTFAAELIQ